MRNIIQYWNSLGKLDCVKEFGLRHKIGHFLGLNHVSRCVIAIFRDVEFKWLSKKE